MKGRLGNFFEKLINATDLKFYNFLKLTLELYECFFKIKKLNLNSKNGGFPRCPGFLAD